MEKATWLSPIEAKNNNTYHVEFSVISHLLECIMLNSLPHSKSCRTLLVYKSRFKVCHRQIFKYVNQLTHATFDLRISTCSSPYNLWRETPHAHQS